MFTRLCLRFHENQIVSLCVFALLIATLVSLACITGNTHYSHPYFLMVCAIDLLTFVVLVKGELNAVRNR